MCEPLDHDVVPRPGTIALAPFVVDALVDLKAARLKAGLLSTPVFCPRTGNYLNKDNLLRAFRAVAGKANRQLAKMGGATLIRRRWGFMTYGTRWRASSTAPATR